MTQRHLFLRDYTTANKHPVGCVMVETDRATNQIRYALSVCSPVDKWNADSARGVAVSRLLKEPVVLNVAVPEHAHAITRLIMEDIVKANSKQGSGKTRSLLALQAATAWLENSKQYADTQAT
jgi:hypothetical protein